MNWNETLIHCSSLSKITTNPKLKGDIEAGNLSETAKTHLIEIYAEQRYNFQKDITTKQMDKGNFCEPEGLAMISWFTGLPVEKNEETFFNEYFVGTPDAILPGHQILFDNKASWNWLTFLANISDELDPIYEAQANGYLDLLGWNTAYIAYTLVDTPEHIRSAEKYALLRKMDVVTEESHEFLRAWGKKEANMIFSNTPMEQRILLFEVKKNEEYLEKARRKVEKSRIFLQDIHEKHKNFNKSFVFSNNVSTLVV